MRVRRISYISVASATKKIPAYVERSASTTADGAAALTDACLI
jgi:hypothetical protein